MLERSRLLCAQRYEKELRGPDAYLRAYQRLETPLSPKQLAAFAGLWAVPGLMLMLLLLGATHWAAVVDCHNPDSAPDRRTLAVSALYGPQLLRALGVGGFD